MRYAYDGFSDVVSEATALDFSDTVSLTDLSFASACDINNIVSQFLKTRELPDDVREGVYVDILSLNNDYHTLMNNYIAANEAFLALPARVRDRFQNDPAQLINFLEDRGNYDEAVTLGLITPSAPSRAHHAGEGEEGLGTGVPKTSSKKASKSKPEGDSGEA